MPENIPENEFDEDALIRSLRDYKRKKAGAEKYEHLFRNIKEICDAAEAAGFNDEYIFALGMNLAMRSLTLPIRRRKKEDADEQ